MAIKELLLNTTSSFGRNGMVLAFGVLLLSFYGVYKVVANLVFHPLAKFPGPKLAGISNYPYCRLFLGGRQPHQVLELHKKYGPVVRVAPNELSFNTAQSWRDIYDFRPGHKTFVKSIFYEGGSFADRFGSIVSERDPKAHGRMRKDLSHAFSQRSLLEQEDIVSSVVDRFIEKLGTMGTKINMTTWFNICTFDIIGDLAFGETFHGVETGEVHPWIARIEGAMMQGALADCFKRFPWVAKVVLLFFGRAIERIIADTKINENYSIELTEKRIQKVTDRKDFLTRILENRDPEKTPNVQIAAHASDFVLAGSETTATALACITYYLFHTPHALERLRKEIRTSFRSYEDINATTTAPLKYLTAVCQEGMRLYSPLPFALPRVVPEGGDSVDGHMLPAGTVVSTNPVASGLDPANFHEPLRFKPERWLEGEIRGQKDSLEATQPFSLGPRGCLGRSLGWVELRTVLSKLHYRYDLELLSTDLDWQRDSKMHTLWQKPDLWVKVRSRAKA